MKTPIIIVLVAASLVFAISQIRQNEADFDANTLLINNKPMSLSEISLQSSGVLSIVSGNKNDSTAKKIPFKIYLIRNDKVLNIGASSNQKTEQAIEIWEVLKLAKAGDELIIAPVEKQYENNKRVIYLQKYNLSLQRNVFGFLNKKQEGC